MTFHVNGLLLADDSHEKSRLVFSEKTNKQKTNKQTNKQTNSKLSSAAVDWRFKG